ncbi:hypothetical protein C8J56DRAFT_1042786 [Mycena floridula]|nr:hypothetical protein C8J56DRAFT_1042786 [Mycena floridula]
MVEEKEKDLKEFKTKFRGETEDDYVHTGTALDFKNGGVLAEIIGEIVLLALSASDGSMKGVSLDVREGPWAYSQTATLCLTETLFACLKKITSRIPLLEAIHLKHSSSTDLILLTDMSQYFSDAHSFTGSL